MSELPLLHIPVRETEEVDFEPGFKDYIERVYQEDPSAYAQEIQTLNRLRQDCRGAGSDTTGRDILYRYYGQLELLDLRFPIDEDNIQIEFPWMDSFSGKKTVQYSLAFEKASIIYNTAAVLSSIASQQPRSDTIGLKTSFNYFQASAGLFLFISENFLHPPSVDLSRDSIKILVDWMLGQAQECFMEKIMLESKRGLLVSKLAMQVSQTYQNILDAIQGTVKGQFDKSWIELAKIKQKYFHALALQHKAIQLEQENKYGELVAYCTLGESVAKEASKLGSSFTSVSSLQGSQTGVQVVAEITKSLLNVMTERKTQVTKDNDMIYHESVPNVDGLPPLEKLNAVKCISFADLLPNGQADLPQIIGPDLFHRLIPIAVHQSSSLYSDEKDKLLRNNKDKIASADQEMDAILQSLNVSQHLSRLKQVMKNAQKSSEIKMPQLLVDGLERLVGERTCVSIDNYSKGVDQLKPRIQAKIQELSQTLEQEQQECERYRGLYLSEWTQEPSIKLSQFMHQDLSKMRQNLEQAEQTDNRVFTALSQHQELVSLFQMPLDQIHHAFSAQLKVKEKRPSLIDESLNKNEMGLLGEQIMVEKLDSMLQRLLNLKKERKTLLGEMKAFMEKDEITSLLLLNRGREGQVFANEIAKYNGIQGRVNDNIQLQNNLLRDLTTEFNNLKEKSQTQSELDELDAKKSVLVERWTETVDFCFQCANDLEQAHRFYNGCLEQLSKLEARISDFVGQRSGEARLLAERLEITKSHREQEQLRMQMQRMQFESQPAKVSSPQLPISSPQIQQNQYPQQQIQQPPIQHQQYPQQQIQQLPIQQQQYPLQQIQQPSYQQQQISQQQQIPQQPYQQQQYPQGQYPTQQYQQPVQNMQSQYQPQMQGQYYPQTVPTGQHPPTQRQDLLQ
ncbi:BRO1-like domain-containing protein [Gorgonomyces haynaldii]|nr:BRO1-like domain-containing protein [Gorgonomyces haynaldii]